MKSKAHSKKCVDLGVSVGVIDEQDPEESGEPPPVFSEGCLQHASYVTHTLPCFIHLCYGLMIGVSMFSACFSCPTVEESAIKTTS